MGGMGWGGDENSLSSEGTPYLFVAFKYSCTLVHSKTTLRVQSLFNFTFSLVSLANLSSLLLKTLSLESLVICVFEGLVICADIGVSFFNN